jgi:hypothetical protein
MTVSSKQNYEDQYEGRITKAARKQQYIMFPAPISFYNNELKAELEMKLKKEKEDDADDEFCSLKVSIYHEDKESKTYTVKVKRYDSGSPEEFLKWQLILAEQVKNNGYGENYDIIMNLAQAMLAGRSLEAFLNEKRSQEAKNKLSKIKTLTEHTPKQIFELSIRAFDIQVDGGMPMRGRENTREEISSWGNSTQKSSVKDCKT